MMPVHTARTFGSIRNTAKTYLSTSVVISSLTAGSPINLRSRVASASSLTRSARSFCARVKDQREAIALTKTRVLVGTSYPSSTSLHQNRLNLHRAATCRFAVLFALPQYLVYGSTMHARTSNACTLRSCSTNTRPCSRSRTASRAT